MATDPNSGHLYVVDAKNNRVSVFDAWGQFVEVWGWGVADGLNELETCTAECQKGQSGSGVGQFNGPLGGIAVDSAGNVYVGDMLNHRIQKFDAEGNFLLMFGGDVDQGPNHPGNLCTAQFIQEGDVCGAGANGEGDGEFGGSAFGDHIAVGPDGRIYVGGAAGRVQVFNTDGTFQSKVILEGLSVSSISSLDLNTAGDFYVIKSGGVSGYEIYGPSGAKLTTVPVKLESDSPLAIDSSGNVFVVANSGEPSEPSREVVEFGPSGEPLVPTGSGFARELGVLGSGGVALQGLTTNVVNSAGASDVYVSGDTGQGVAFISSYGEPPDKWPPPLAPPGIITQFETFVGSNSAVLGGNINPHFWSDARYYVEIGPAPCTSGGCTTLIPTPPGNLLGGGIVDRSVATQAIAVGGLQPNTTYHYRFVAQSSGAPGQLVRGVGGKPGADGAEGIFTTLREPAQLFTACPNQVFRSGLPSASLPDCRAYEMVSPIEKDNVDIKPLPNFAGVSAQLNQSSDDGERMTYTTSQGFGDAAGVPYVSQYLASRTATGWVNHGITPSQGFASVEIGNRLDVEFRYFTNDLCNGILQSYTNSLLAPNAVSGIFNLYARGNCGGDSYVALSTLVPESGTDPLRFIPELQGASSNGRCGVFWYSSPQHPLYESCEGAMQLISVLPNGNPSSAKAWAGSANEESLGVRTANAMGAVSATGETVYWSASGVVYVRIHAMNEQSPVSGGTCTEPEKACTIKLPLKGKLESHFWGASSDGGRAVYTRDENGGTPRLLEEFNLEEGSATEIASEMLGVVGVSQDASRVAFVSREVLGPGPNAEGKSPAAGQPNFYLFDSSREGDERYRFIGTVAPADAVKEPAFNYSMVAAMPFKHLARMNPAGDVVTFMSSASLTGYDNVDQNSGQLDQEIYVYDSAGSGRLACASCNPSGQRPVGSRLILEERPTTTWAAALLTLPETESYAPRVITNDGSKVFFDSYEALVQSDTNGKVDVYEWERPGAASAPDACTTESPRYSPANGGCISLISTGKSISDSTFVDASPSGRDVFISTGESLVPQDTDLIDIYDARIEGGFPSPPTPPAPCTGESCQGPASTSPGQPAPNTTRKTAGNPKFKPSCGKRHHAVKRKGKWRCVKNKSKHGHKSKKHGQNNGRGNSKSSSRQQGAHR
jgi:hypothetical protein